LLLLIAGGSGGAATFNNLIPHLIDSFTVVSYDRRGFGGSTIDNPDQDVTVGIHADDAHWLLAALTNKPAYVCGSSAGALIALDLTARYPEQVRRVVAHEPPAGYLLAEKPNDKDELSALANRGGLDAFRNFAAQVGAGYEEMEPGVARPQANLEAAEANANAFFKYTAAAVRKYRLDLDALRTLSEKLVIGGGLTGQQYIGYLGAVAVAQHLGLPVVDFPSDHTGYVSHPTAFAVTLRETLA
jgi:pimeloyl-ACP methyl ester carboxylesterase